MLHDRPPLTVNVLTVTDNIIVSVKTGVQLPPTSEYRMLLEGRQHESLQNCLASLIQRAVGLTFCICPNHNTLSDNESSICHTYEKKTSPSAHRRLQDKNLSAFGGANAIFACKSLNREQFACALFAILRTSRQRASRFRNTPH
jgi:hypothetical protein